MRIVLLVRVLSTRFNLCSTGRDSCGSGSYRSFGEGDGSCSILSGVLLSGSKQSVSAVAIDVASVKEELK